MYAVASVLSKTLQMSFNVDPGVRYLSVGPTISALASAGKERETVKNEIRCQNEQKSLSSETRRASGEFYETTIAKWSVAESFQLASENYL
jgi:hypothetical protein